jgi:hypothetical protein
MNSRTNILLAVGLTYALLASAHAQADPGLQAINDLAQLNGQALACQDLKVAGRAKGLMLAHAPKTARFGNAFEEGTQQSYLAQLRNESDCPDTATLSTRLNTLAQRLQTNLPATTPNTATNPTTGKQ